MDKRNCIIIGGGHAAAEATVALRKEGWPGAITVICDEPYLPYHRPPLSKTFLAEPTAPEAIYIRNAASYAEAGIDFRLGKRATAIDRDRRVVEIEGGETLPYDALLIATGAAPRKLALPGSGSRQIHYVRGIADIEAIRPKVVPGCSTAIVGGGFIGLEAAAMLRKLKLEVTVIEALDRVLKRVTAPEISAFYERVHHEEGVRIITGAAVGGLNPCSVLLDDGQAVPADIFIVGIGVTPETALAETCGLAVDDGIVVDESCRTSDPAIFAAGDCTRFVSRHYGRRMRLESVQNANDQGRIAAAVICGRAAVYDAIPWFWSDQYDLKLQIAGLSTGYDEIAVRGDIAGGRSFAAFYLKEGEIISVDAVNRGKEFMAAKRLIASRARIRPSILADDNVPAAELLRLPAG